MKIVLDKSIDMLLIDPPWYRFFGQQSSIKPLGLCSLAGLLEKNGFRALVYNADLEPGAQVTDAFSTTRNYKRYLSRISDANDPVWQEIKDTFKRYQPKIIGITVLTAKYRSALNLAKIIKEISPGIKIIGGGIHPTLCPEEVLKTGLFDIIVKGEGELTMLELANALRNGDSLGKIKGISYKEKSDVIHNPHRELIKDLDTMPWPANHLILNKEQMVSTDFGYIMATRGCPYGCIFCASHKIWGRKVRFRSPGNIVDEIKMIKKSYSPVSFHFQDDSFSLDHGFVESLCSLIVREGLHIRWVCETRIDLVSDALIKTMRKAGCFKIILGVESGNEETLLKIKKQISKSQIRKTVEICKKNHMETSIFFMIGFPWEREKEINETASLMEELDPQYAVFSIATPYPGTELYKIYREEKLLPKEPDWASYFHQSPEMFLTNSISPAETKRIIEEVERKFVRHNKKKHRLKLLNPYRLFLELRKLYRQPKELVSKVRYIIQKTG